MGHASRLGKGPARERSRSRPHSSYPRLAGTYIGNRAVQVVHVLRFRHFFPECARGVI